MDNDPEVMRVVFILMIMVSLGGVAILIKRREAHPGVVAIVLILPFVYLFGIAFVHGELDLVFEDFSTELVIGIIASIIGGLVLLGIKKK